MIENQWMVEFRMCLRPYVKNNFNENTNIDSKTNVNIT